MGHRPELYIVICIPIARQWLGKHFSATNVNATIEGYPLLGNGDVNTVFSAGYLPKIYKGTENTHV